MKILFMGTPDFAVPALEALLAAGHFVCGVITQPDKPKNRGMKLLPTPVKECALSHDLPVFQPETVKEEQAYQLIASLDPELIVVAAYGKILPERILNYPKFGCINVHSSLLPKYRGAAPIHWAILNGEKETGVSIMYMVKALDAGDVLATASTPIDPNETVEQLHDRLAQMGGTLLCKTIAEIAAGTVSRTPQAEEDSTYAPMLTKALSPMDWSRSAQQLHNQVRGLAPWPAAITKLAGVRCKIFATTVSPDPTNQLPGTVLRADKRGIVVACGGGTTLCIQTLQADGGKRMDAASYLNGHPLQPGVVAGA